MAYWKGYGSDMGLICICGASVQHDTSLFADCLLAERGVLSFGGGVNQKLERSRYDIRSYYKSNSSLLIPMLSLCMPSHLLNPISSSLARAMCFRPIKSDVVRAAV